MFRTCPRHGTRCRPDEYPPYPPHGVKWERGQALVEFALILPVMLFCLLGALEAGFLVASQTAQARNTGVLADWVAHHPTADYAATETAVGLSGCTIEVTADADLWHVGATCHYTPHVTNGLGWEGLPISTDATAAAGGPAGSPAPSASVAP